MHRAGHTTLSSGRYDPAAGPRATRNASGTVLLELPVTTGRVRVTRDADVVLDGVARPGMVWIVRPDEHWTVAPATPFDTVVVALAPTILPTFAELPARGPVLPSRPEVRGLCPALASASRLEGSRRDVVADGLARTLVGLLMVGPGAASRSPHLSDLELRLAEDYAEARLTSGIDLLGWAAELDMPARDFSRRFRNATGATPYAWFLGRRIEEAVRLLRTSEMPVIEIASHLGFSSQSHFTDAFRAHVGTSPGRWRREHA